MKNLLTPTIDPVDPADPLAPLIEAANELVRRSLATGTLENYVSSWSAWEDFAVERAFVPLPAAPEHVALFLAKAGCEIVDDRVVVDDNGNPLPGRLRPTSIIQKLTAINRMHDTAGLPRPGDDERVRAVVRGLRRTFGVDALKAKAALDMHLVELLLAVVDEPRHDALRDAAVAVLTAADASPGVLCRLEWGTHVHFADDGSRVDIEIRIKHTLHRFTVRGRASHPASPVAVLRALRVAAPRGRFVLEHPTTGKPMTRQGVAAAARRLGVRRGDSASARPCDVARMLGPTLTQRRDRCLLLMGWYGALRRSNLVAALWDDLIEVNGDWQFTLRRSKNNVDGAKLQRNRFHQSTDDDWPCAASAIRAYRDALASALHVRPRDLGPMPVFVPIDRHGNIETDARGIPKPLSGDAVCDLVQNLAGRAGLKASDFGAHSLRSGFITEALRDDKLSVADVKEVTHHVDSNVLFDYRREVNLHATSPIRKMFAAGRRVHVAAPPTAADVRRARRSRGR